MHMIELLYSRKPLRVNEQIVKNRRKSELFHLSRTHFILEEAVKEADAPPSAHHHKSARGYLTFLDNMLK